MRKHRVIWDCRACGKRAYPTQSRAHEAIENHLTYNDSRGRLPGRAYECPWGNGWHLTSKQARSNA